MADLANVRRALYDRLETLVLTPAHEIAWPEPTGVFVPPADARYLECRLSFNRPRWQGVAGGGLDQGLLTVTVIWPKNRGDDGPIKAAQAVRDHFGAEGTLSLFYGGTKTKITGTPYLSGPLYEPTTVRVPVTIPWTA